MSTHIKIELPRNSRSPDAIALLKGTCLRSSSAGAIPNCRRAHDSVGFAALVARSTECSLEAANSSLQQAHNAAFITRAT